MNDIVKSLVDVLGKQIIASILCCLILSAYWAGTIYILSPAIYRQDGAFIFILYALLLGMPSYLLMATWLVIFIDALFGHTKGIPDIVFIFMAILCGSILWGVSAWEREALSLCNMVFEAIFFSLFLTVSSTIILWRKYKARIANRTKRAKSQEQQ